MISENLIKNIKSARRIVIFSGAGMSAESGVPTFRDVQTGLWEKYDPMELATAEAFANDPALVWGWYEWRRNLLLQVPPNAGHIALAKWQSYYPLNIVTQNVDDLHERAGSYNVVHIHGSIHAPRCSRCNEPYYLLQQQPIALAQQKKIDPPLCELCEHPIRPGVVWFGEELYEPELRAAIHMAENCDMVIAVGTSGVVQPAALIPVWAKNKGAVIVQINPSPTPIDELSDYILRGTAATTLPELVAALGYA